MGCVHARPKSLMPNGELAKTPTIKLNGADGSQLMNGSKSGDQTKTGEQGSSNADNTKQTVGAVQHRQNVSTIELLISCRYLPHLELLSKPNALAVIYIEQGSIERAQKLSQFIRESELEDHTKPLVWIEKDRTEIQVHKQNPIFHKSIMFEAVNHERLIIKVEIYNVSGDKKKLSRARYDSKELDLKKCKYVGEQVFRLYDVVKNNSYETKALRNYNPKQEKLEKLMRERKTTITLRFDEVEQTTTIVSMAFGIREYDNGKANNTKTITFMFYVVSRQRDMGEFVTVYTSELRKYDFELEKANFAKQDIMLKDMCRNEESAIMRLDVYEYKELVDLSKKKGREDEEDGNKKETKKWFQKRQGGGGAKKDEEEEEEEEEEIGDDGEAVDEEEEEEQEEEAEEEANADNPQSGGADTKADQKKEKEKQDARHKRKGTFGDVVEFEERRALLSTIQFRVDEVLNLKNPEDSKKSFELFKKDNLKQKIGTLLILRCCFIDRFTFLDYIHAGCEISTMIGMDFTLSNRPCRDPKSLHYLHPDLPALYQKQAQIASKKKKEKDMSKFNKSLSGLDNGLNGSRDQSIMYLSPEDQNLMESLENPYQAALRKTLKYLDYYDTDGFMPFIGYGAKLPPFRNSVSHSFAVNGNIFAPEERGILDLMRAYTGCLSEIQFHGPNAMAPLLRFARMLASQETVSQTNQFYFILVIFCNGKVTDHDAVVDELVKISHLPMSIVMVGVAHDLKPGEDWYPDFSSLEIFDSDHERLMDSEGNEQIRDCTQFLNFLECRYNDTEFAIQLMAEIPKQIKEFFESQNLVPMDQVGDMADAQQAAAAKKNRRDFEINKRRKRAQKKQTENPLLMEKRSLFIDDIEKLGFPRDDVELVLEKKGLYALDKSLILELLSAMQTIPELMAEKNAILAAAKREQEAEEEKERKRIEDLNRFGDIRDQFLYKVPCLAPEGFKPLKKHKAYCKICYENRINCAFMPCKCQQFCMDCATTPDMLKENCPICGENIEELIRTYDIKQAGKHLRQL